MNKRHKFIAMKKLKRIKNRIRKRVVKGGKRKTKKLRSKWKKFKKAKIEDKVVMGLHGVTKGAETAHTGLSLLEGSTFIPIGVGSRIDYQRKPLNLSGVKVGLAGRHSVSARTQQPPVTKIISSWWDS